MKKLAFRQEPGVLSVGRFRRNAVQTVLLALGDGQQDSQKLAIRRKDICDGTGGWKRIRIRHMERQAVREKPASVQDGNRAVTQSIGVERTARQSPWFEPKR